MVVQDGECTRELRQLHPIGVTKTTDISKDEIIKKLNLGKLCNAHLWLSGDKDKDENIVVILTMYGGNGISLALFRQPSSHSNP